MNRYFFYLCFCVIHGLNGSVIQNPNDNACSFTEFRCDSGECIDDFLICDGKPECQDHSDETESCKEISCPGLTFRCNYGACISRKARCNGIVECADGSDESLCATNITSTPRPVRSCLIPGNIANGKYAINDQLFMDRGYVPNLSTLIVNCDKDYSNDPPDVMYSICRNGAWVPNPPICSRSCFSLPRRRFRGIICDHQGMSMKSCNNPVHGVRAAGACFNSSTVDRNYVYICNSGNWEVTSNVVLTNE